MWSCALQVGSLWTAFMLPSAWCAWARGAKDVTYNEMDKMWFESLLCCLQTIYHLTIDWKMVMNEAMKLMGSLSAQNLCTDCPFHTFFWAGPLFLETFPTFLLFLHRSSSESSGSRNKSQTDFCIFAQKSVYVASGHTPIFCERTLSCHRK